MHHRASQETSHSASATTEKKLFACSDQVPFRNASKLQVARRLWAPKAPFILHFLPMLAFLVPWQNPGAIITPRSGALLVGPSATKHVLSDWNCDPLNMHEPCIM